MTDEQKWILGFFGLGVLAYALKKRAKEGEGEVIPTGPVDVPPVEDLQAMTGPSPHFTWEELQVSATADKYDIENTINEDHHWENLYRLTWEFLEPIRDEFGPVTVTSAYRNAEVQALVNSKTKKSQHTEGEGADIVVDADNDDVVIWIKEQYDAGRFPTLGQAITYDERGHVHISIDPTWTDLSSRRFLKLFEPDTYVPFP